MAPRVDKLDLSTLGLSPGAGRRMDVEVAIGELRFGGERYAVEAGRVPARLEVSRLSGPGYALRLRFVATLRGPCMRCLQDACNEVEVEAREVDTGSPQEPGDGAEELSSPYVTGEVLDLPAWARDALVLSLPPKILCREDCLGLCPVCAADLNAVGADHTHASGPDPRWAKLSELRLE
jgi:uncharacterized protein